MAASVAQRRVEWNLRGIGIVALAHATNDFYAATVPLLIFYDVSRWGLSPWYQGALAFVWYLTSSIVQPLFGFWSDRHGRWWFLPAGVLLTTLGVCALGVAPAIPLLCVAIVCGGLGSAIFHPEAGRYTAMLSGTRKAGGISVFQFGGTFGFAFGPALIGTLLARGGGAGSLALSIVGLAVTAGLFATMRGVAGTADERHAKMEKPPDAIATGRHRSAVTILVASMSLRFLVAVGFMTYLPNVLVAHGASLVEVGWIVTAYLAVQALGQFAGGFLSDRMGPVNVSVASMLLSVPFFFGFTMLPPAQPLGIVLLLAAGFMISLPMSAAVVLAQAMLPRNLGMALGLMNGVAFGAGSALVTIVGVLVARSGPGPALAQVSFIPIAAAAALLFLRRNVAGKTG